MICFCHIPPPLVYVSTVQSFNLVRESALKWKAFMLSTFRHNKKASHLSLPSRFQGIFLRVNALSLLWSLI